MAKNYYLLIGILCAFVCAGSAQPRDLRTELLNTYRSQIGVRELTGHNDGKSVEMYLHYCGLGKGNPWCASFYCWGLGQNNIANPRSGYCPDLFTAKHVIYRRGAKNNQVPQPGDAFGLYFPEKGRIAHTGPIELWGDKITTTIEGNTNDAGSRDGDGVYRKKRLTNQIYEATQFVP